MISNKKVVMSIPLLIAVISASTITAVASMRGQSLLQSAFAVTDHGNNNNGNHSHKQDKVKVDCDDLVVVLIALRFSANR